MAFRAFCQTCKRTVYIEDGDTPVCPVCSSPLLEALEPLEALEATEENDQTEGAK